jgi:hypothetical protein
MLAIESLVEELGALPVLTRVGLADLVAFILVFVAATQRALVGAPARAR